MYSHKDIEKISLFAADGLCENPAASKRHINVVFLNCTCPIGFESSKNSPTKCECVCDSLLSPHITDCHPATESLLRLGTNSWITYVNDTNLSGYVIHPNCPFDYCYPPAKQVSFNLNQPGGTDSQCSHNRTGVLCGACHEGLGVSLGSSRCLPCHGYWPAVLAAIVLAAVVAGILLVIILLILNMTVAVGLINGLIFYANIMAAISTVLLPSSEPSFPTVFVGWLNLDIGFDVCIFDGFDAYCKLWLQLAFPIFIVSLVVLIIVVSEYSPRFASLIGRRDPVATLATLILLSYSKLLSTTIAALSFTVLHYPDGSKIVVWLPDGNVKYLQGKHIALVIAAILIILIGIPYTLLLFLWQWLVKTPDWRILKWTRNTKLYAIITTYHTPYDYRHRYWTGLLLIVRVVLYLTSAITVSTSPQLPLLMTVILIAGLLLLKGFLNGAKLYKQWPVDVFETMMYFNLLVFAAFSLYNFKTDSKKQTAVIYTSTAVAFILLIGVIVYQACLLMRRRKDLEKQDAYEYPPAPISQVQVTHTVVDIHIPQLN